MKERLVSMILTLCIACTMILPAFAADATLDAMARQLDGEAEDILKTAAETAGNSLSDWAVLLAARSGITAHREDYLNALWDYVSDHYAQTGALDTVKATEWHRIALTVTALGADATCFGTDAQGNSIDLLADGTYNWSQTDSLGKQGINGWVFALLALDARQTPVPTDAKYQREDMVAAILAAQEADGGFGLSAGQSETDVTAMVLQALAPYADTCTQQIDRALDYLSACQTQRGDFESRGATSAEGSAQVIIALCALGIDPRTDSRFVKEGGNALDGLLLYQTVSGGFCHTQTEQDTLLATEQAGLALCAISRMDEGHGSVYDFSDTEVHPYEYTKSNLTIYFVVGAVVLVGIVAILVWKGKKKCLK